MPEEKLQNNNSIIPGREEAGTLGEPGIKEEPDIKEELGVKKEQDIKEEQSVKFIICPVCHGTGKGKMGLSCSNCAGMGTGGFFKANFFYWGPKLGRAVIKLRHIKKSFNLFLNLASLFVGLIGLASLTWWIWQVSISYLNLSFFAFWRIKSPLILIFWLSVIADMFIIYRLSEEERSKHKIVSFKYRRKEKLMTLPNNWQELKKIKPKRKIDVAQGFDEGVLRIVEEAYLLAKELRHEYVLPFHLFLSLLKDKEVVAVFMRLNVKGDQLITKIKNQLSNIKPVEGKTEISNQVKEILVQAYFSAYRGGQKKVKAVNLILPIIDKDKIITEILYDLEVTQDKIYNMGEWFRINERMVENYRIYKKMARYKPSSAMNRAYTAVATPVLNHFSYDLTIAAKWGRLELCVARDKEIEEVFQAIESGHSGIILVGPVGTGKRTVVHGIAQLMVKEDVPKMLKDKRLVELDIARLVSGASPAQAQERLLVMIDEVTRASNIILFIDNIENIVGISAGEEQSLELSEVLANALERQSLYCIASVTNQNYTRYIEGKPVGNAMSKVVVKEAVGNQAIQIIESKIGYFEDKYKVYYSYNAIEQAVQLSTRYMHDKYLPAKAIDVLEKVAIKVGKAKGEGAIISKGDVAVMVSEITNIPVAKVTEDEGKKLLVLETTIHQRMVNQEEAVDMVAASLRRARAQMREGKRPIANFLFLGPTGVGKTELAKTVAEVYFGSEKSMVRVDMSEYQHHDSIKKMIGDASGALGYLTEAVRKKPFSLLLLDEFEKAHANILNLFLQVMDDGRLTDGQGRTIDFTNCILIATSNAGAVYIQEQIIAGTNIEKIKSGLINEHLNKVMRPELINRFDGVIVFKPLSQENVVDITKLMLVGIAKTLESKGVGLRAEEEGVRKLAQLGFDPKFGARPLRRLLQERVENIIANKILNKELERRDVVVVDANAEIKVEKGKEL